jgi:hypothetical protein
MAQITPPSSNQEVHLAIADLAGSALDNIGYDSLTDLLDVPDVNQVDLDAALVTYNADPAAADATWAQKFADMEVTRKQAEFDDREVLRAFAKLIMNELNILRAIEGLPPRTFDQLRTAIRNEIANP